MLVLSTREDSELGTEGRPPSQKKGKPSGFGHDYNLCMIMKCWRCMQCISIGKKRMYQVHKYTLTFEDLVEVLLDVLLSLLVAFATLAVFDDGVSYVS